MSSPEMLGAAPEHIGRRHDVIEGHLIHRLANNAVLIDVEPLEERLVEAAAHRIGSAAVQRLDVAEQRERSGEQLSACREFLVRFGHPFLDAATLQHDLVEPGADLRLWQCAVGGQVDEPLLLHRELAELLAQQRMQLLGGFLAVTHRLAQRRLDRVGEAGGQLEVGVLPLNGLLDLRHRQVRQVTDAVLSAEALEVTVEVTVSATRLAVDQPAGPASRAAALAEQHAFEVVVDQPVALPAPTAGADYVLHLVEQLLAHDRFVSAGYQLSFVGHKADVVRVLEHGVQLARAHRPLAGLGGRLRR